MTRDPDEVGHFVAGNLIRLRNKVDDDMCPPSFLAVLTATGPAYTREDGIHVIPLICMRN